MISLAYPRDIRVWFNALDERDVVALYPLSADRFPIDPPIENYNRVRNGSENAHGIDGYLGDAIVAKHVFDALTQ